MPSHSKGDSFRTTNLTLAAYLATCMDEPSYRLIRGQGGRTVIWEFRSDLDGSIEAFNDGTSSVEPNDFHRTLATTRRIMVDFIKSKDESWSDKKVKERL